MSDAKEFLRSRALAYKRTFATDDADHVAVLKDLAKFCRAVESTFHPDPRIAGQLDGRREVFLRIQQHLQLSTDQLWALLGAAPSSHKGA
jgi:hypothetical protein